MYPKSNNNLFRAKQHYIIQYFLCHDREQFSYYLPYHFSLHDVTTKQKSTLLGIFWWLIFLVHTYINAFDFIILIIPNV